MSEATGLGTETCLVYVRLLGEGTVVFRPVKAVFLGPCEYKILPLDDYDPEEEEWEFAPGTFVRTERRILADGDRDVAIGLAR